MPSDLPLCPGTHCGPSVPDGYLTRADHDVLQNQGSARGSRPPLRPAGLSFAHPALGIPSSPGLLPSSSHDPSSIPAWTREQLSPVEGGAGRETSWGQYLCRSGTGTESEGRKVRSFSISRSLPLPPSLLSEHLCVPPHCHSSDNIAATPSPSLTSWTVL